MAAVSEEEEFEFRRRAELERARSRQAPKGGGVLRPVEDFTRPIKAAADKLVTDARADYDRAGKIVRGEAKPSMNPFEGGSPQMLGNVLALAASPFQGAADVVVRPAARLAIDAGLPVYEQRNPFSPADWKKGLPQRVEGQQAEDIVAGDINTALMGARAGVARAPRPVPQVPPQPPAAINTFATRARPDVPAMRARAAEMRRVGVEPTLTDVSGEQGRRLIRAVGVRGEAAGEVLTERAARTTATTKPAAMAATRRMNRDPRTATQYADDLQAARDAQASQNYGRFDAEQIEVPDTVRDMLADSSGRSIIARARADAIENQDWGRQVELDRLLQSGSEGGVGPLPRISAGTIDRLVIAARERGTAFARRGNGNRARGAFNRRAQLDATLDGVEELRPARQTYSNQSRAMEIARNDGRLDPFSTDPTDYASWLNGLPQEAQQANQIAIRQEILDTLGGQRTGGSLGTLDDIATSPYARDNLRAAFGPEVADRFIGEVSARLAQTRNATFVQPNAGSRTAVLENDVGNAAQQTVGAVRQGLSGDIVGLAARAVDAWRRRGINPQQAEELARIAVDPRATDAAIEAIAARLAPQDQRQFLELRAMVVRAANAAPRVARPAAAALPAPNVFAPRESQRPAPAGR